MSYCVYQPSIGKDLFKGLKKQFGYDTAREVFLKAINPEFISDYKDSLSLDAEGIPSLESVLSNTYIQKTIGNTKLIKSLQQEYPETEDTINNYTAHLESAYSFNTTSPYRDALIAIVEHTLEDKIRVSIVPKNEQNINIFNNQYSSFKLNSKLEEIFKPLGITIGNLSAYEVSAGRVGLTDFSKASKIAIDFSNMIKVANNMEGSHAISEEFAHLIIGVYKNDPIVKRAINTLISNRESLQKILGDQYSDTVQFHNGNIELIAEEAVGQILQKNLLETSEFKDVPSPSLFKRMVNYIKSLFKRFDYSKVDKAIIDSNSAMSDLAKSILNGTKKITQDDIINSERDIRFNALSNRISRNIKILEDATKVEIKRQKITSEEHREEAEKRINKILIYADEKKDTVLGIYKYAKSALSTLKGLHTRFQNIDKESIDGKFKLIRLTRSYIQSYHGFIESLSDNLIEEEGKEDSMFLREFKNSIGDVNTLKSVLDDLVSLSKNLTNRYIKLAIPTFAEFLKPYVGDFVIIEGNKVSIEDALNEAEHDISFLDRWIDSMADSSDPILQSVDLASKYVKDNARLKFIEVSKEIQKWRMKAESLGITDFEWMFEKDSSGNKTGDYISEVNNHLFIKELEEMENSLEEKYGKNPKDKESILAKARERGSWLSSHALNIFGTPEANPYVYRNKEYDALSETQKELLNEYLDLKEKADNLYPKNKVYRTKAIQMRKTKSQRMIESVTSVQDLINNIKQSIQESFLERTDDDQLYGERTKRGITDFGGNEFMTLPVLYTNKLENANDLSTDVVASLMCYTYNALNYEALESLIDPLEVGKIILEEHRKVRKTQGSKKLVEKINSLGIEAVNKVYENNNNILARYNDFLESQIYQRYLKDEGTFGDSKLSKTKAVNWLLKVSSTAQLGFNWLANLANATNGLAMQNIEATAGEFFNASELKDADIVYSKELTSYIAEIGSRTPTNKLALFMEMFDIKQDYGSQLKDSQKKNLLERLFGANIGFIGQQMGDHWLYNRTAIAMVLRHKVNVPGKGVISLWDALQVENKFEDNNQIKILRLPEGTTNEDGSTVDIIRIGETIDKINQHLFGIYNETDSNAANRVSMGRLLMQYRKWMKPSFNKRFQAKQYNAITGKEEEGYYRTLLRFALELKRGQFQLASQWKNLTVNEKANIKRSLTEIIQFLIVSALVRFIDWGDDDDRPWAAKLAEYTTRRLKHELGSMVPGLSMVKELSKTVSTPMASISVINSGIRLVDSLVSPEDWTNELQSGPYKGMSTLQKNIMKAPIPGLTHYRQMDRFLDDVDTSIQFYVKSY